MPDFYDGREESSSRVSWEDAGRCTGCRACEIACSFHHAGVFQPTRASIHVKRDDTEGRIWLELETSCDQCLSESDPLCIRFCAPRALTLSVLNERWTHWGRRKSTLREESNT